MVKLEEFDAMLRSSSSFFSGASGREYKTELLLRRFEEGLEELEQGNISPEEFAKKFPRGKVRNKLIEVLRSEWIDLCTTQQGYSTQIDAKGNSVFRKFTDTGGKILPYQGYKLRISAKPHEGREIAKAVLPFLRKNNIVHKVAFDIDRLERFKGGTQQGKFISIYPTIEAQGKPVDYGAQLFTKKESDLNKASVNINAVESREILNQLLNFIENSHVGIKGEVNVPTDKQVKNTRIYYRYGIIAPSNGVYVNEMEQKVVGTPKEKHLVDVYGNNVPDSRENNNWKKLEGREPLLK